MMNEEKIKVMIADDDDASVQLLSKGLEAYPWVEICATASSAEATVALIEQTHPDLLFLDIELRGESGLDVIRGLPEETRAKIRIVFYSSYRKYLLQAIRLDAFDFLLKPFDPEELSIIMMRYSMDNNHYPSSEPGAQTMPMVPRGDTRALSITTITNDRMILSPHKIVLFKYDSDRKLWEVVLNDFRRIILKRHTKAETILNFGSDFIRTHKAYIINIAYLGVISNSECTLVPPYDKIAEIKIGKAYKRQLLDHFYDL